MPTVAVLMSTYNGEKYIQEQLDSIFAQRDVDVKLYVRDDGSKDTTIDILRKYKNKYPVEIIQDGVTGLLYQPENIEELFLKMKFFLENRKSISEFGKNGRKRAEECFSIEKNTDAIMELYKKVLHLV